MLTSVAASHAEWVFWQDFRQQIRRVGTVAKYDITYSCGHKDTVTLFGPTAERDRKIEWMESKGLCPECYKVHISEQREKASKEAAAQAKDLGLPLLTGSVKQIAWAETIRRKSFEDLKRVVTGSDSTVSDMLQRLQTAQDTGTAAEKELSVALLKLIREPSAKWWIDHRGDTGSVLQTISLSTNGCPDLMWLAWNQLRKIHGSEASAQDMIDYTAQFLFQP